MLQQHGFELLNQGGRARRPALDDGHFVELDAVHVGRGRRVGPRTDAGRLHPHRGFDSLTQRGNVGVEKLAAILGRIDIGQQAVANLQQQRCDHRQALGERSRLSQLEGGVQRRGQRVGGVSKVLALVRGSAGVIGRLPPRLAKAPVIRGRLDEGQAALGEPCSGPWSGRMRVIQRRPEVGPRARVLSAQKRRDAQSREQGDANVGWNIQPRGLDKPAGVIQRRLPGVRISGQRVRARDQLLDRGQQPLTCVGKARRLVDQAAIDLGRLGPRLGVTRHARHTGPCAKPCPPVDLILRLQVFEDLPQLDVRRLQRLNLGAARGNDSGQLRAQRLGGGFVRLPVRPMASRIEIHNQQLVEVAYVTGQRDTERQASSRFVDLTGRERAEPDPAIRVRRLRGLLEKPLEQLAGPVKSPT